ncbi:MAG: GWxTD domain-containing protein [Bacteroidota bacterium]
MKKNILCFFISLLFFFADAQINTYFNYCSFNTPNNKPYIETYLSVFGESITFVKNEKEKFQGSVEIGIIFLQNGQIKTSKKYNLLSPEISDTINRPNFIDQQRFLLDNGMYEMEISIADKNRVGKIFSAKKNITIDFPADKVSISDIQLIESYKKSESQTMLTKSGFDIIPYVSNFYPENINEMPFYAEIYNTKVLGENEKYLLNYYIESYENKVKLSKFTFFKRETSSVINILLSKFAIAELPNGNFNLVVEVRNKNNELVVQKKTSFQRKNPKVQFNLNDIASVMSDNTFAGKINSKDSLAEFIRSLCPIATESEKTFAKNQLKLADTKLMQQFFYNFWTSRSVLSPEQAWLNYYNEVKKVNKHFGTHILKGYETDRGRIYLQYGPPDNREEFPSEPTAYPYEMWFYYKLIDISGLMPSQTNKKFIFYNPDLVTNNYTLLHSNARGEIYDSRWEMKLHRRTVQSHDFEKEDAPRHYGGNANDEFNNPK